MYIRNIVSPLNSSVTLNVDILSNLSPPVLYDGGVTTVQSYARVLVSPAISDVYLRYEDAGNVLFGILRTAITVIGEHASNMMHYIPACTYNTHTILLYHILYFLVVQNVL